MRVIYLLWCSWLVIACTESVNGNANDDVVLLQGQTMGTTWHVTIVSKEGASKSVDKLLKQRVKTELKAINQQFSTYIPSSEVSRFNALNSTQPFNVSKPVADVIKVAQAISKESQGAFDISVAPLVELWGFGKLNNIRTNLVKPSQSAVLQVRQNTGYQHLTVNDNPPQIAKGLPKLEIDLSAIAKGYGVDRLAELIESQGFNNYLVEIGGEIKVKGHNSRGELWRIAIEKPVNNAQMAQQVVRLKDLSVATSGDYRHYFEESGVRFSHAIDPKTGSPVTHQLASVTVLHESAMIADGLATAILVLGEEKGLAFAKQKGLSVYLIIRTSEGHEGSESFKFVSTLPPDILVN